MIKVYHGANVREGQYAQSKKEEDERQHSFERSGRDRPAEPVGREARGEVHESPLASEAGV